MVEGIFLAAQDSPVTAAAAEDDKMGGASDPTTGLVAFPPVPQFKVDEASTIISK